MHRQMKFQSGSSSLLQKREAKVEPDQGSKCRPVKSGQDLSQNTSRQLSPVKSVNPVSLEEPKKLIIDDALRPYVGLSQKKRDKKQQVAGLPVLRKEHQFWHCCLKKNNGGTCQARRLASDQVVRHLQSKMHFGQNFDRNKGIPDQLRPCTLKRCKYYKANEKQPEPEFESAADVTFEPKSAAELRDLVLLNIKKLRSTTADQIQDRTASYWQNLHQMLNDEASLNVLSKDIVDTDDQLTLEGLGILQLWVFLKGTPATSPSWAPVLSRVAQCKQASKNVINYVLNFDQERDCPEQTIIFLQENLSYFTFSTLWLLLQDVFWCFSAQMEVMLVATFTIADRFQENIGNLIDFSGCLKSPSTLSDQWFKAIKRQQGPLNWNAAKNSYLPALLSIKNNAQVLMLENEHLLDWINKLFGDRPLHSGQSEEEYWMKLRAEHSQYHQLIPEEQPEQNLDFFHAAAPKLFANQRVVSSMVSLISQEKNTWTYLCLGTGFGKTTLMCELGYDIALKFLSSQSRTQVNILLLVVSSELASFYSNNIASKTKEADDRIQFQWMDHESFRAQWKDNPKQFLKQIMMADEGDLPLTRDISHNKISAWPRGFVLLSAITKNSWTSTQKLSFDGPTGKHGVYVDANCIFPQERIDSFGQTKLLPTDSTSILRKAIEESKNGPVLFWGDSKTYQNLKEWPKNPAPTSVRESIQNDANEFFDTLLTAKNGFYFLDSLNGKDEMYLRAYDYRNSTSVGIQLFLADKVTDQCTFLQACGRVRRGADEGTVYFLPMRMWRT